jgi:hypothetical protein
MLDPVGSSSSWTDYSANEARSIGVVVMLDIGGEKQDATPSIAPRVNTGLAQAPDIPIGVDPPPRRTIAAIP